MTLLAGKKPAGCVMSLAALIAVYLASSDQPAKAVQSRVFLSEDISGDPCKALYRYGQWLCLRENGDQHGDTVAELLSAG